MFKHLMNGGSLLSYALYDGNNDDGSDTKEALRAQLSKGNLPTGNQNEQESQTENTNDEENETDDEENEDDEENDEVKDPPENETEEQKAEREAKEKEDKEKLEAKANRKQDRMQRRIDKAVAEKKAAEAEIARLKAQLEANPDQKLTAEEVESLAEAKAAKKLAEKAQADLQADFEKDCEALAKAATKADADFDAKIHEIAEDIGPIPSFMIGILADLENGGEVLAHIANDDELAEDIWAMRPAKMTRKIVEISTKLADAKKPAKKQISKVPDPGSSVKTNRIVSNVITEADAKNMDTYVAKRQKQMMEKRKAMGFG